MLGGPQVAITLIVAGSQKNGNKRIPRTKRHPESKILLTYIVSPREEIIAHKRFVFIRDENSHCFHMDFSSRGEILTLC